LRNVPRPTPPPPSRIPIAEPFNLDERQLRDLSGRLGVPSISPLVATAIAEAIACHKAAAVGSSTVGNTLAELRELKKSGRAYDRAVARLANDRSGVDYVTHALLQPLAKAVQAGDAVARDKLAQAAVSRTAELNQHPRVQTTKEPMRFFCGVLREIFRRAAAPALQAPLGDGWHHCRRFALEVFTIAGIEHADFDAHPERLTEYLGTDVSDVF
jgi:hypothetical protein